MSAEMHEDEQPFVQRTMVCLECLENPATEAVWFRHNPGPWSPGNCQAQAVCPECIDLVIAKLRIRAWRFRHLGAETGRVRHAELD